MRLNCALLLLLAGCSSIATSFDFDPDADFAKLKSYAWRGQSKNDAFSPLVYERIVSAGDRELAAKGYRKVAGNPDFHVAAHGRTDRRVQVTDFGYDPWYRGGVSGVDVYEYDEGTLIVDIVDVAQKKLVWRGTARKTLSQNPDAEETTKTVDDVMAKLFADFPPPGKR